MAFGVIIFPFLFLPAPFKMLLVMMGLLTFGAKQKIVIEEVEARKVEQLEDKAEIQPK